MNLPVEKGANVKTRSRYPPLWVGAAGLATILAFASAAISLYWTLGGTLLLDTVGGSIERLARTRSLEALLLGSAATAAKVAAGVLSIALLRPHAGRLRTRLVTGLNLIVSVGLIGWGAANVAAGALVLGGVLTPNSHPDERALRWHVFVWDLWFLFWGVMLGLALIGLMRARRASVEHAGAEGALDAARDDHHRTGGALQQRIRDAAEQHAPQGTVAPGSHHEQSELGRVLG
jgi:hypothetical protein